MKPSSTSAAGLPVACYPVLLAGLELFRLIVASFFNSITLGGIILLSMRVYRTLYASASLVWICLAVPSANADVTYDYTGTFFSRCGSSPNCPANYTSDYIIASISLAAPLPDSLPLTDELSSLTAWRIGDALGNFSFSSTDPNAATELMNFANGCTDMSFSTDQNGNIADWCMLAENSEFLGLTIKPTFIGGSGLPIADTFLINPGMPNQENVTTSIPGQWTEVPEPSSWLLTFSSVALLFIAIRQKPKPAGGLKDHPTS